MRHPVLPALLLSFVTVAATAAAAPRPNIVVILADDLGSHDVSWRGSPIKTPALNALAAAGAKLDAFYVQPLCSPTRAALLTGRYPFRHGLQVGVVRPWAKHGLPLDERTLPQALKDAGYQTAIIGKWHLGHMAPEYLPTRRGFDHQYGHYNGALDHFTHVRDGGFDWHRDDKANRDEGYTTHLLAREAVRTITDRDKAKPLFLYVAFTAVHAPLQVPDNYKTPYANLPPRRQTYAGMVAALDEAVGQIRAALSDQKIERDTLTLFSADNGGPNPGRLTDNGPYRAGKGTVYEGGVRTCAFATWPGQIKPNTVVTAPLHIVDLYPTLLTLAGAPLDQKLPLDGKNAWPTLTAGAGSPHADILINTSPKSGAIRTGDWKLVIGGNARDDDDDDGGAPAPPDAKPAPAAAPATESIELFNLAADPGEKSNLADKHPDVVARLRARYADHAKQAVAPKAAPKPRNFQSPKVWGEPE